MKFPRVSGYRRLETFLVQEIYIGVYEKIETNPIHYAVYYCKNTKWMCLDTYADLASAHCMILEAFGRYDNA